MFSRNSQKGLDINKLYRRAIKVILTKEGEFTEQEITDEMVEFFKGKYREEISQTIKRLINDYIGSGDIICTRKENEIVYRLKYSK